MGSTACKMEDVASHFLTNVTELQGDVNSTYEEIKGNIFCLLFFFHLLCLNVPNEILKDAA